MATLVADCPHCGAKHVAFPIVFSKAHQNKGNYTFNVFGWCAACGDPYSAVVIDQTGAGDPKPYEGNKLCTEGLITKEMRTWAHKIRLEGNEAVHEIDEPTKEQATELKLFTEMVLTYLYTLPAKVKANLPPEEPQAT
jgi:recombinational DNA repair protein (RecF pathway)